MDPSPFILQLTDPEVRDLARAGGKGANLGELVAAGFEVPAGFVVTTAAYQLAVAGLTAPDQASVAAVAIPDAVAQQIRAGYQALGGQVAVRSSATAEDLPGAAFAGQQDTFLAVTGTEEVLDAVRRCWSSLWTERAVSYRDRLGIDSGTVAIAVVVQAMVPAEHAGVMFTADPVTGYRDRVVIDSSPGLGEAVVAGLVTPDHAVLDAGNRVLTRSAGKAETVIRALPDGGTTGDAAGSVAELEEGHLAALADVGRAVADHFNRPQDIEWAVVAGRVHLLQARPMTALPPAPIKLTRRQRITGPVILELLPRRPLPLELGTWTLGIAQHVQDLAYGLAGIKIRYTDIAPSVDSVVQGFVPPNPHPSPKTPARILRSIRRSNQDPAQWEHDPRLHHYRNEADRLSQADPRGLTWRELLTVPAQVHALVELMTDLRVEHLPGGFGPMVRLRLLLKRLGLTSLFSPLLMQSETVTERLNDDLAQLAAAVAATVPDPSRDPDRLLRQVQAHPDLAARFDRFLADYGHRETGSILLAADPSWSASPETVMSLIVVLMGEQPEARPDAFEQALSTLLQHRHFRSHASQERVKALVAKASLGVAVREDTHFELTRTMPAIRNTMLELGRRLAQAGALASADDIWYLSWEEVTAIADPASAGAQVQAAADRRRAAYAELAGAPLIASATLYPKREDVDALVTGVGGGNGRVTGTVRIISTPAEFGSLQPGEVLVCPATNPAWTPLFTRAAAVVVDHGGLASHAAIVAREYGIPSVMGTGNGTAVLRSGASVVVDGDHGTVALA
ncbi:MAG: PEP/pyruvate-binding domain-containing protein [Beutenbergiaceae bacterium]